MSVYSPVTTNEIPNFYHETRRARRVTLAIYIVIFVFVFVFSALGWYFYAKPTIDPNQCGKRLVGYYRGWGDKKMSENQLKKLTHIIFSSASMNSNGTVNFGNEKREQLFLEFRNQARDVNSKLKILVAIGQGSYNSSDFMVETEKNETFTTSITEFIEIYQIDGVELQWKHYPKLETVHQLQLIQNLRKQMIKQRIDKKSPASYLLTLSVPGSGWPSHNSLELDDLLDHVDFVNVASYDSSGTGPGPIAPLYSKNSRFQNKSVNRTLSEYACQTKHWRKLNMGMAFFGKSWKNLLEPVENLNESTWRSDELSLEGNVVHWRTLEKEGLVLNEASWDEKTKSSYIWNSEKKEFIGFENQKSLTEKVKYAKEKNLGGLAVSMLDYDDDDDTLLNTISSVDLCSGSAENDDTFKYNCTNLFFGIYVN